MLNATNPWNIGTLDKSGIFGYYISANILGVLLCTILMYSVYKNSKREVSDIFVAGIASGCQNMSLTCGLQCWANAISNEFVGGNTFCIIESIAHVSAIPTQFLSVTGMALVFYLFQVKNYKISHRKAFYIVVFIWCFCTFTTCLLSLVSRATLMSNGVYCFFEFSSPAIAYWMIPCLILALGTMIVTHILIIKHYTMYVNVLKNSNLKIDVPSNNRIGNPFIQQFRWRSTVFILVLLINWGPAAFCTIYVFATNTSPEWIITWVGEGGTTYSYAMAISFAFFSKHYRKLLIYLFAWPLIICKGKDWYELASGITKPVYARSTKRSTRRQPSTTKRSHTEHPDSPIDDIELPVSDVHSRPSFMSSPSIDEKFYMPSPLTDVTGKEGRPSTEHDSTYVSRPSEHKTFTVLPTDRDSIHISRPSEHKVFTDRNTIYVATPLVQLVQREGEDDSSMIVKPLPSPKNNVPPSPRNRSDSSTQPSLSLINRKNTPSPRNVEPSPRSRKNVVESTLDLPSSHRTTGESSSPRPGFRSTTETPTAQSTRYTFVTPESPPLDSTTDNITPTPSPVYLYTVIRDTNVS